MFYRPFPANGLGLADVLKLAPAMQKRGDLDCPAAWLLAYGIVTPYATGLILTPDSERTQPVDADGCDLLITAIAGSCSSDPQFRGVTAAGQNRPASAAVWDRLLSLPVPFFAATLPGPGLAQSGDCEMSRITGSLLSALLSGIFPSSAGLCSFLQRGACAFGQCAGFLPVPSPRFAYLQVRQREFSGSLAASRDASRAGDGTRNCAWRARNTAFASWAREFRRRNRSRCAPATVHGVEEFGVSR